MTDKKQLLALAERCEQLADFLERDALETLNSEGATYWYEGRKYAVRDKVDWALGQLDRAAALRSRAAMETDNG